MPVMGATRFERFFRAAAGLDVEKLYDLLIVAQAAARSNQRDVIQPWDLPITKGLQERTHEFRRLDQDIQLQPILDSIAARPPLDLALSDETEARLPELVGGMSLALARSFRLVDPDVRNPQTWQWERAFRLFELPL
jgi:hypothetical protein